MRSVLPLLLVVAAGCADVSGLNDFELAGGGSGGTASGSGPGPGAGPGGFGGAGGGAEDRCPTDVTVAQGPFGSFRMLDELNTPDDEDDPTFTADGLELYFNREDNTGTKAVWRSVRTTLADPWGPPAPVASVNVTGQETNVVVAPDGLTLWMNDGTQAVVSRRSSRAQVWPTPVVEDELPTPWFGSVDAVSCDQLHMLLTAQQDIYETRRASILDMWEVPTPSAGLGNQSQQEAFMSHDARHVYWAWSQTMYRASREEPTEPFSMVETVSELSQGTIGDPWLDATQSYMIFAAGTFPRDLVEARR